MVAAAAGSRPSTPSRETLEADRRKRSSTTPRMLADRGYRRACFAITLDPMVLGQRVSLRDGQDDDAGSAFGPLLRVLPGAEEVHLASGRACGTRPRRPGRARQEDGECRAFRRVFRHTFGPLARLVVLCRWPGPDAPGEQQSVRGQGPGCHLGLHPGVRADNNMSALAKAAPLSPPWLSTLTLSHPIAWRIPRVKEVHGL